MTYNTGTRPTPAELPGATVEFATLGPRLWYRNRFSREPVVGDALADVSLTSFGKRCSTVWKTIETIGAGTVKPCRLILWLDEPFESPQLSRLQSRGLEVRSCKNYGPHKKYFPYVSEETGTTLVTADDDAYYPPTWLEDLLNAYRGEVTAYRARVRSDGPYASWPICSTTESSFLHLATGVSGVAYPPSLQEVLRDKGDAFMDVCPRADDFWLHYAAVSLGIPIRQVSETAALWWEMPIVSKRGLWDGKGSANDAINAQTRDWWLSPPHDLG